MRQHALALAVQPGLGTRPAGHVLQRKSAGGTHSPKGGSCGTGTGKRDALQREAANQNKPDRAPDIVRNVLSSPGRPLDAQTRAFFEPRFGHDFSGVRVHTDVRAAESARAVDARAYTVGRDVVFADGQYSPHTAEGRHLLAHEFTHTIQQGGMRGPTSDLRIGDASSTAEREGSDVADAILSGRVTDVTRGALALARQQAQPATESNSAALISELQTLVKESTWEKIRARIKPKESVAGIQKAKERHEGKRADLTGLGKLTILDQFAGEIRKIQANWSEFATPDDRVNELGKAANAELKAVDVPEFLGVDKEITDGKARFDPERWKFWVNEKLVSGSLLNDYDAAELAHATLHESRHAEQRFLSARFSAGKRRRKAWALAEEQHIPDEIAQKAIDNKFDSSTDAEVAGLGKLMFQSLTTEGDANMKKEDLGLEKLNALRAKADEAWKKLRDADTPGNVANAEKKRDALKEQIAEVERRYTIYRHIPFEADAHDVGLAEEQALGGWQ